MEIQINKDNNAPLSNDLGPQYCSKRSYQKRGPAIFGYQWKLGELVILEQEAAIRKAMYQLFLQTKRKKATATALNNLGFRTRNGELFSHTTINRLLNDTTAKGIYKLSHGDRVPSTNKSTARATESSFVSCPAIITEKLWNECQEMLKQQATDRSLGPRGTNLLAGLLYCMCGKKMYVYHRNKYPAFRCKGCHTKILVEDIHAIYHEQLHHFVYFEQAGEKVNLYTQWPHLNIELQHSIIETITKKIIVFNETIDINFLHQPAFPLSINVGISEQLISIDSVNK